MHFAGGFQGRTNKLVDSCYSFWMGAIFPQLRAHLAKKLEGCSLFATDRTSMVEEDVSVGDVKELEKHVNNMIDEGRHAEPPPSKIVELPDDSVADYEKEERDNIGFWLYDQRALQNYILFCAQEVDGGMKDKPGK